MLFKISITLLGLILAAAFWVRLAPSDPDTWHQLLVDPKEKTFATGVIQIVPDGASQFTNFIEMVETTRLTLHLAGSTAQGAVTYITRTKFWGFPDYNTIWIEGDDLIIYARLRFGLGDRGVNAARVSNWVGRLSGT